MNKENKEVFEDILLTNGRTVADAERASAGKVESIYKESWEKGISVPFFDDNGNIYLANPDGSEDKVRLNPDTRTYHVLQRVADPGKGTFYKKLRIKGFLKLDRPFRATPN